MSGIGNPELPSHLPVGIIDGDRVFSPLSLLERQGRMAHFFTGSSRQIFADYRGVGIVFLPHFVEGPSMAGHILLEPFRFLWRISFSRGFSFIDLVRERRALPWAWYQIDSTAFQRTGYWIFRLACAALLLGLMAGLGRLLAEEKKIVLPQNRKVLFGTALLSTLLLAKDLFVIWVL